MNHGNPFQKTRPSNARSYQFRLWTLLLSTTGCCAFFAALAAIGVDPWNLVLGALAIIGVSVLLILFIELLHLPYRISSKAARHLTEWEALTASLPPTTTPRESFRTFELSSTPRTTLPPLYIGDEKSAGEEATESDQPD